MPMNLTPLLEFLRGKKTYCVATLAIAYLAFCQFTERRPDEIILGLFASVLGITLRSGMNNAVKLLALLLLPALLLVTPGCRLGPADGRIVGVTQSVIGIDVGQAAADSVPHLRLGYVRSQFHIVPTGSNIYAPAVLSSMSLDNTFSHQVIDEDFATGGATRDISPTSPAATGSQARAAKAALKK